MNNETSSKFKYLKTETFNNDKRYIKTDENSSKKINLRNLDILKSKEEVKKNELKNTLHYIHDNSITHQTHSSNKLLTDRNISDSKLQQTHSKNIKYLNYLHLDEIKTKNENKDLKLLYNPNFKEDKDYLKFKFKDDIELCLIEKKFESNIKSRLIKNHRKFTNISKNELMTDSKNSLCDLSKIKSRISLNKESNSKNQILCKLNNLKSYENVDYNNIEILKNDKYHMNRLMTICKVNCNSNNKNEGFKQNKIGTYERFYKYNKLIETPFYESKYYNIPDEEISFNDIKGILEDLDSKSSFFKLSKNKIKNPILSNAYISNYIRSYRDSLNN